VVESYTILLWMSRTISTKRLPIPMPKDGARMLKRISFGLKNTEVYVRKMMCEFSPLEAFHTI